MEQWEIDLREKLQKELPDGIYEIGFPGSKVQGWTGKGGHIEFMVAMQKHVRGLPLNDNPEYVGKGILEQAEEDKTIRTYNPNLNPEKIKEILRDIMYGSNKRKS